MINWKVRFKNKVWLVAFLGAIVAFIYQILGMFGCAPSVSEAEVSNLIGIIINLLVALGIVVDPTTAGLGDSERAMNYDVPYEYIEEGESYDEG